MAQTFKTYDGVEVLLCATVYMTGVKPPKDAIPNDWVVDADDIKRKNETEYRYFSTKEACQAYIDEVNKPKSIMGEEWDRSMQDVAKITSEEWVKIFRNMKTEPTPIIVPSDNNYQLNVSGGESEPNLHSILTQFSEAYKIPINDILQFIINQKSK